MVLVFGVERTCNYITSDFEATQYSFVKQLQCKYWAERCFIIDRDTIEEDSRRPSLHPLLAIGIFFCNQKLSLISMEHKDDITIQTLYKIAKEQMEKESVEKPITSALLDVVIRQTCNSKS